MRDLIVPRWSNPVKVEANGRLARRLSGLHGSTAHYHGIVRTISLKLPDDLLAQLTKTAKARRVTKSSLVRESLEKALHPKPHATTSRATSSAS
jgi:Ribbon-helix-helix protein, copG family